MGTIAVSRCPPALLGASLFALAGCAGTDRAEPDAAPGGGEADRFTRARAAMVETLRRRYRIEDGRVLRAVAAVPRHRFVPGAIRDHAYRDRPLPIGRGQTISQPYIVALMTEQLRPRPDDIVLEIGTGSGYQAAVLAGLVGHVYTIEIVEELAAGARAVFGELRYRNVTVRHGDGYRGWLEHAPFDAIVVTCAPDRIPEPLVEQLKDGGRMIIPVGEAGGVQKLYLLEKRDGEVRRTDVLDVRFVPMTGEVRR